MNSSFHPWLLNQSARFSFKEIISTIDGIQDDVEAEVNKITKSVDDVRLSNIIYASTRIIVLISFQIYQTD